jgi:hypothetical protein
MHSNGLNRFWRELRFKTQNEIAPLVRKIKKTGRILSNKTARSKISFALPQLVFLEAG